MSEKLADLRRDYGRERLIESDVDADPLRQFSRWLDDAVRAGPADANAMTLATADADGRPAARVMLLKGVDGRGLVFYSNERSRKGRELAANPFASLCFWWAGLERQVRVEGRVERVAPEEADEYFASRPRESQIGAHASDQSEVIPGREPLERRFEELARRFAGAPVPRPPHWGGYRLIPTAFEFWQGRPSRLHDRLRYRRASPDQAWVLERLAP